MFKKLFSSWEEKQKKLMMELKMELKMELTLIQLTKMTNLFGALVTSKPVMNAVHHALSRSFRKKSLLPKSRKNKERRTELDS
jgi:hypothetical protein